MKAKNLIASSLIALSVILPVQAQTIASKIESLGEARYVKVVGLMGKERNGFLVVQAELSNSDSSAQKIYWRVKWLDVDGFQVWDDEAWKPMTIHGNARQNIMATAPTPKARDFRIQYNAEANWSNMPANSQPGAINN